MPQLDGIRAIAVIFVVIHHYFPYDSIVRESFRWGWFGVRLFFVLSGFLITSILLTQKNNLSTHNGISRIFAIKQFYIRRSFRIFPLYYLYVCILLLISPEMKENFFWFLTYTQNYLIFIKNDIAIVAGAGHLWTLAIEEQFYLFWPLMIILFPNRYLVSVILAFICIGICSRFFLRVFDDGGFVESMVPTTSNLDSLALGAMLAYFRMHIGQTRRFERSLAILGCIGFMYLIIQLVTWNFFDIRRGELTTEKWFFVTSDFFIGLLFIYVLNCAANNSVPGFAGNLLSSNFMTYIGKISYGIYVYHVLVQTVFSRSFQAMGVESYRKWWAILPLIVITLLISSLSFRYFENPINQLKNRFPYTRNDFSQANR